MRYTLLLITPFVLALSREKMNFIDCPDPVFQDDAYFYLEFWGTSTLGGRMALASLSGIEGGVGACVPHQDRLVSLPWGYIMGSCIPG